MHYTELGVLKRHKPTQSLPICMDLDSPRQASRSQQWAYMYSKLNPAMKPHERRVSNDHKAAR
jgi:hypothetical protein